MSFMALYSNDTRNSMAKRDPGVGPRCMKNQRVMAAPMNASTEASRRPRMSETPGTANCPIKPPKPSAEEINPICCTVSCLAITGASVR